MKKLTLQWKTLLTAGRGTQAQSSGTTLPSENAHPTSLQGQKTLELPLTNFPAEVFAGNDCHQNKAAQIIQDILFPHKQIHQTTQTFLLLDFSQQQSEPWASKHQGWCAQQGGGKQTGARERDKTASYLNMTPYLISEVLGNDSATAEIKTSSCSTEVMCSGPITEPSPSFPSKVDAGLR